MDDGSLMDRFEENSKRYRARDAILVILFAGLALLLVNGSSIKPAGEKEPKGVEREVLIALGGPAGWVSDQLPLNGIVKDLTAGLSPDEELAEEGGFSSPVANQKGGVPVVTADAFDPASIGAPAPPKRPLKKLLVTGDSLSTPMDNELARTLARNGVKVVKEPILGTGISKTDLLDWGAKSLTQTKKEKPEAVVVFIGANEGFPMEGPGGKELQCCDAQWAATYANRVRQIMNTYRQNGTARVYWLTIPTPRDPDRQKIERIVNVAIGVAAQPWRSQIGIIDTRPTFTPGDRYRDSMDVNGKRTLVRESDGIHLNEVGSRMLSDIVVERLRADWSF